MPYSLDGKCVKDKNGNVIKCHRTKRQALAHFRALKLNVEKEETKKEYGSDLKQSMIAFYLPESEALSLYSYARSIAQTTDNVILSSPEEYHLTLCYLGETDYETFERLSEILPKFSQTHDAIRGKIQGIGRFFNEESDGSNAFYASFDGVELPTLREDLINFLKRYNVTFPQNHGFTPHITLAYIDKDSPTPPLDFPFIDMTFSEIVLAWGDYRIKYHLEDLRLSQSTSYCSVCGDATCKAYNARAGEVISGNLCRGPSGAFAACGSPGAKPPRFKPQSLKRPGAERTRQRRIAAEGRRNVKRIRQQADERDRELKRQQRARKLELKRQEREARRKKKKPAKTPEQREQEKKQKIAANRSEIKARLTDELDPSAFDQLMQFADGSDLADEFKTTLVDKGLVEESSNGDIRLSKYGKSFVNAADKGEVRDALDALSRAQEREEKPTPRRRSTRNRRRRRSSPVESENNSDDEEKSSFTVYKNSSGQYRWLLVSSTGFRDQDGEIVASKALSDDVLRADNEKDYGPLLWWHLPIKLGDCDFNAMHSKSLIESGTFVNDEVAEIVAKNADTLQASILFKHKGRDKDKVYWYIRRKERSLLPLGKASNLLTKVLVVKEKIMEQEKIKALKDLGATDELLQVLLSSVEQSEKSAEQAGMESKEVKVSSEDIVLESATLTAGDGTLTVSTTSSETVESDTSKAKVSTPIVTKEEVEAIEEETDDVLYVGDMTPDEFMSMFVKGLQTALSPLLKSMADMHTNMKATERIGTMLQEMKGLFMDQSSKEAQNKEAEAARLLAQQEQLSQLESALKESKNLQEAHNQHMQNLEESLKELRGEQPKAFYRASADASTVIEDEEKLKSFGLPTPDKGVSWIDSFIMSGIPSS